MLIFGRIRDTTPVTRRTGGFQSHLVADVVVVVAQVPEGEVDDELNVNTLLGLSSSRCHLGNSVGGLILGGLGKERHGRSACRAKTLAREEHVGPSLGDARSIAAGTKESTGLLKRTHINDRKLRVTAMVPVTGAVCEPGAHRHQACRMLSAHTVTGRMWTRLLMNSGACVATEWGHEQCPIFWGGGQ